MPYKLEQIFTKTDEQDWSKVIIGDVSRSMNSTPDSRDDQGRSLFSEEDRTSKYSWFVEFKNRVGSNYIGWDREYRGNNQLALIFYLDNENTARLLEEALVLHRNALPNQPYQMSYRLTDNEGNEISL